MIVNINPSPELYDETQQVLKMCAVASKIKNKPVTTKMLRQSTRFTTYVYGNDTFSLNDDDQQCGKFFLVLYLISYQIFNKEKKSLLFINFFR